jgi:hypothetical protein
MWERLTKTSPFGAVLIAALDEARRRGDRRLGTDHLLLGLLRDGEAAPARALGVTLDDARAALADLDHAALAAIGLDVRGLRLPSPPPRKRPTLARNALTASTRAAIHHTVDATHLKARRLAPNHLLRSLLNCAPPDPAAELLARLGIDPTAAQDRLTQLET